MNNQLFDADEIRKAIGILKPNHELFEVRILQGYKILSGYFRDADRLLAELNKQSTDLLRRANIYITLQELHPGCEARLQWNQFLDTKKDKFPTTSDNDVTRYKFIPIDIDPIRPADISSTEEELAYAADLLDEVLSYMAYSGWTKHIEACSGNGYHLLFPCDSPVPSNDVADCLSTLDELFTNSFCKIDTTLSNPARIIKLYGTIARKGRSTETRPHRLSKILKVIE